MDLLTTVRKEGSRGGRGDFKWSDVQSSTHRENYLGHSLMAPVGRWQRGRDLNWYAKGDADEAGTESLAEKAERERKDEIKRIKEAEQDALARALGYDVPPKNPNLESLGDRNDVDKIVKEAVEDDDADVGKGVGYGKFSNNPGISSERIQGDHVDAHNGEKRSKKHHHGDKPHHRRRPSRSRSRDRDRHRRRREKYQDNPTRRSRSRSREPAPRRRSSSRDRTYRRTDDRERRERREHARHRSRSPTYSGHDRRRDDHESRRR